MTTSDSSSPPAYAVGDSVEVLYDPADPGDARRKGLWLYLPALIGGVVALLGLVGGLLALRISARMKRDLQRIRLLDAEGEPAPGVKVAAARADQVKTLIVSAGMLAIVAVALCALTAGLVEATMHERGLSAVRGTVKSSMESGSGNDGPEWRVTVTYPDGGVERDFTEASKEAHAAGERVRVVFRPGKPDSAAIEPVPPWIALIIAIGVMTLIGLIPLRMFRKSWRLVGPDVKRLFRPNPPNPPNPVPPPLPGRGSDAEGHAKND